MDKKNTNDNNKRIKEIEKSFDHENKVIGKDAAVSLLALGTEHWNKTITKEKYRGYTKDFGSRSMDGEKLHIEFLEENNLYDYSFYQVQFGDGDVFFDGVIFSGVVSFEDASFGDGNISFENSKFDDGDVSFRNTQFGIGDVDFSSAEFGIGSIDFQDAIFGEGEVSFEYVRFGQGDVSFKNTQFGQGEVLFSDAKFGEGKANFKGSNFSNGYVSFVNVEFGAKTVDFKWARFGDGFIHFDGSEFLCENLIFEKAVFGDGDVCFEDIIFECKSISFDECCFGEGNISFDGTRFADGLLSCSNVEFGVGNVSFDFSDLGSGTIDFNNAFFGKGILSFRESNFGSGTIDFSDSIFEEGEIKFNDSNLNNKKVSFNSVNFKDISIFRIEKCLDLDLRDTDLSNASIRESVLDNADLRAYSNIFSVKIQFNWNFFKSLRRLITDWVSPKPRFRLDDNSIRNTRFSHDSLDPYSILRRSYTGNKFILVLFFTIFAMSPLAIKAIGWSWYGSFQNVVLKSLDEVSIKNEDLISLTQKIKEYFRSEYQSYSAFEVVIGSTEKDSYFFIAITVIVLSYNVIRGWVTLRMSAIREEEERSKHSPALKDYLHLYKTHQYFLRWVFFIVIGISCFKTIQILSQPVDLPRKSINIETSKLID